MSVPFGVQFEEELPQGSFFAYDEGSQTHNMSFEDMKSFPESVSNPETGTGTLRDHDE